MEFKKIKGLDTTTYNNIDGVGVITYKALDKLAWINNGFSTRIGGISKGQYSSMNLSFTLKDDENSVRENFRLFGKAIEVSPKDMVYSHQTHTNNVMEVTDSHRGMGILTERDFSNIDGIITNTPGICLVTSFADCVPLYFIDPVHKAIGLSHSGWRGTVSNICGETLSLMKEKYNTNPKDIIACIGPSICVDCYEVSEDVMLEFSRIYKDMQLKDIVKPGKLPSKYQLDLHKANYYNLINAGVLKENISMPDICTCCNSRLLHSHRATKGLRGGLCAFLQIKY